MNFYPAEVYPHWDNYWEDVVDVGRIDTFGRAIGGGELPAVDPHNAFGHNHAGDLYSPWAPLHFLAPFVDSRLILWLDQLLLLTFAGMGAYFYIHYFSRDRFISLLAALTCCSMWKMYGSLWYHSSLGSLYFVPLVLLAIHSAVSAPRTRALVWFTLISSLAILSQDTFSLFVIPPVTLFYAFAVGWGYHRLTLWASARRAVLLCLLCLWGAALYIVPFYNNCETISDDLETLRQAIPEVIAPRGALVEGFGGGETYSEAVTRAFAGMSRYGGLFEPLFLPTENPYNGAQYLPIAFYITVIVTTICVTMLFRKKRRQLLVVWSLLAFFPLAFIMDYLFWSPFSRLGPLLHVREATQSILCVPFNLNIAVFVNGLAPFLCFAAIVRSPRISLRVSLYAVVLVASLMVDLYVFVLPGGPPATAPFASSNRIPIEFDNVLHFFPVWNFLLVLLVVAHDFLRRLRVPAAKMPLYGALGAFAICFFVVGQSAYNEWSIRCGSGGRLNTRSDYRWKGYLERERCFDSLTDRGDLNYRYLVCGKPGIHGGGGDGRDWKAIAETELHTARGYKVLFSCRNYTHPYAGLMRRLVNNRGGLRRFSFHPPLTSDVEANLGNFKGLLGLKYVLSIDQEIDSPHVTLLGQCETEPFPEGLFTEHALERHLDEWKEEGPVYVYEVNNPTGIAFLVDHFKELRAWRALRYVFESETLPWNDSLVYLEKEPTEFIEMLASDNAQDEEGEPPASVNATATIVRESYSTTEVHVVSSRPKLLVMSYIHRPFWTATVNGEPQEVYRAYGGFLCVPVPPGESTVRLRYVPWDVYLGLLLTLSALPAAWVLRRIF